MVAGMEPNAENKLFVGGCPTGSSEDDLRAVRRAPAMPARSSVTSVGKASPPLVFI